MNNLVYISIIIPAYNAAAFLDRCIKSIQSQSINNIEIIIINNGSTDKTDQIIDKYKSFDMRIKKIKVESNRGVGRARNLGLQQSCGKYIMFCDSDDAYPFNGISRCYEIAEKEHADIVVGNFTQLRDDEEYNIFMPKTQVEKESEFLAFFDTGVIWNKLYRKSFLEKNNLCFKPYSYGEDTLFLGECYICDPRISFCTDCMYLHYHRSKNFSVKQLTKFYTADALGEYLSVGMKLYKMPFVCEENDFVKEYLRYLKHVYTFWWNIPDREDMQSTFSNIREFTRIISWNDDYCQNEFRDIFGIDYQLFQKINFDSYLIFKLLSQAKACNSQNMTCPQFIDYATEVNNMYSRGELGFRYIIRYTRSWLKFKIHRGK